LNGFSCNENGNFTIDKNGCGRSSMNELLWFDISQTSATFRTYLGVYTVEFRKVIGGSSLQPIRFVFHIPGGKVVPIISRALDCFTIIFVILTILAMIWVVITNLGNLAVSHQLHEKRDNWAVIEYSRSIHLAISYDFIHCINLPRL
jgi:hypothetical protein